MNARVEAERRQEREAKQAVFRKRLVDAAGIDPAGLGVRGRRILDWLAAWDDPTVEGLEEILAATRTAAQMAVHRGEVEHKAAALRQAEASTQAAMACFDAGRDGARSPAVGQEGEPWFDLPGAFGRVLWRASYTTALLRMVLDRRDDNGVVPLSCVLAIRRHLDSEDHTADPGAGDRRLDAGQLGAPGRRGGQHQ